MIYQAGVLTWPSEKRLTLCGSWVLTNTAAPSTSEITLQYLSLFSFWHGLFLSLHTAFLCQSSYFSSLKRAMVGHFSALLPLCHCLQFEPIWLGESRCCAGEGHCWVCTAWAWLIPLRHSPWLWLDVEWWILANQITATRWSHRRLIFFTVDLYCIVSSDHNDNFNKYNKKIVTDYKLKTIVDAYFQEAS